MNLDFSIITEHNHNISKAVCFHLQVKMKTKENCFQNAECLCSVMKEKLQVHISKVSEENYTFKLHMERKCMHYVQTVRKTTKKLKWLLGSHK